MKRLLLVVALCLAGCRDATGTSGPPAPTLDAFDVAVSNVTATIRNAGGPGDVRLTVWGSTIGGFNGEPARSFTVCARAPLAMAAGERQTVDLACTRAEFQGTVSVRDAASPTGWRITACRSLAGECNPDVQAGTADAP